MSVANIPHCYRYMVEYIDFVEVPSIPISSDFHLFAQIYDNLQIKNQLLGLKF